MNHSFTTYYGKHKAFDLAVWLNFEHRLKSEEFGAIQGANEQYLVVPTDHPSFEGEKFEKLPNSYRNMTYDHIQQIAMDYDPLPFWEIIRGMMSTGDGEVLRFILKYNVPLHKFIRFELAARGYDADHRWCGFESARKIWLR
ncbi:MAG: hypothetical protein CMI36_00355 [Owenweeksia sp.]|nr:hypothetical protein [Owenweeksia sp.]|tara:strand:- start:4495 stop:4920 length:426 start_codon:yes stop_codon:yes gene_type:complete